MHKTKYEEKNFYLKIFSFFADVVDTADKHSFATFISEYLRKFSKKFEMVLMGYSGDRGTLIYEKKPEGENLVSDSL